MVFGCFSLQAGAPASPPHIPHPLAVTLILCSCVPRAQGPAHILKSVEDRTVSTPFCHRDPIHLIIPQFRPTTLSAFAHTLVLFPSLKQSLLAMVWSQTLSRQSESMERYLQTPGSTSSPRTHIWPSFPTSVHHMFSQMLLVTYLLVAKFRASPIS